MTTGTAMATGTATARPSRRRARRITLIALATIAALFIAWLAFAIRIVMFPTQDAIEPADVIIVIGPTTQWRQDYAKQLSDEGFADTVALMTSSKELDNNYCARGAMAAETICFYPDPFTTQGEATWVREQADARGWESIIVITMDAHIERARFIFAQCLGDKVNVAFPGQPDNNLGMRHTLYNFAYQTIAWAKAVFVTPGCA